MACKYEDICKDYPLCRGCGKYKKTTNADRIRAMSDKELEILLRRVAVCWEPWCDNHCKMEGDDNCNVCLSMWLKQPAEEGDV